MRLQRISKGIADNISVEDVKEYAHISSATEDALIASLLVDAINKVEDIANISITNNSFVLYTEKATKTIKLFNLPVSAITSVKNALTGATLFYTTNFDFSVVYLCEEVEAIIEYTTTATQYDTIQFKPYVLELASAFYDGVTDNAILGRIYAKIPRRL